MHLPLFVCALPGVSAHHCLLDVLLSILSSLPQAADLEVQLSAVAEERQRLLERSFELEAQVGAGWRAVLACCAGWLAG
jgi:hypothetical protein